MTSPRARGTTGPEGRTRVDMQRGIAGAKALWQGDRAQSGFARGGAWGGDQGWGIGGGQRLRTSGTSLSTEGAQSEAPARPPLHSICPSPSLASAQSPVPSPPSAGQPTFPSDTQEFNGPPRGVHLSPAQEPGLAGGWNPRSLAPESLQDELGPSSGVGDAPNAGFAGSDRRPVGRTQCFWGLQAMPGFRVSLAETRRRASSAQGGALWPKAPRGGRGTPRGRGRGPSWVGFSLILQNNCHSTVTAGGG